MNINEMKRAIHIICMHHFLYFESHKKNHQNRDTLLFVSVYFLSVLHLQYEHILLTSEYLEEISRKELLSDTCINNGSKKIKKIKKNKHTFAWIWGLTGITFARRKSITIVHKMYMRFGLHLH